MIRFFIIAGAGLALAGCSSAGLDRFGGRADSLTAAPTAPVQSQTLSPLNPASQIDVGQDGALASGQPGQPINNALGAEAAVRDQFTPPEGAAPSQPVANLTPPANAKSLSRTDLLGAWTVASGAEQCKLNVNLTSWNGGYRASTRGCQSSELQRVNAWNLQGNQVVLLAEDGSVMAQLYSSSAGRFDGQIKTDGRAVSFFR
ncbi:MAG: protease inhibitor Inh/omp19 family protein [Cohaesibacter sp.]|nr:protease inhibitor Inh/omp19 family protein [Cohaesibacter sp.]MCV6602748.1 protease inhibitor Inh/omp19 family protein [Cohaesibacter sp.]